MESGMDSQFRFSYDTSKPLDCQKLVLKNEQPLLGTMFCALQGLRRSRPRLVVLLAVFSPRIKKVWPLAGTIADNLDDIRTAIAIIRPPPHILLDDYVLAGDWVYVRRLAESGWFIAPLPQVAFLAVPETWISPLLFKLDIWNAQPIQKREKPIVLFPTYELFPHHRTTLLPCQGQDASQRNCRRG